MLNQAEKFALPIRQSFESIGLVQVPEEIGTEMVGAFPIENRSAKLTISKAQARHKLRGRLENHYWWLSSEWALKNPNEQLLIAALGVNFDVYNFAQKLTDLEIEKFRQVASVFSQMKKKIKPLTFLISDHQSINPYNREPLNGVGKSNGTIKIEPNARLPIPHRIVEVDNWTGTLTHETGHFFLDPQTSEGTRLANDWRVSNGWIEDPEHKPISGEPDRKWLLPGDIDSVTDYARFSPFEDFTDSLVAALHARGRLDAKRLEFLDKELGTDRVDLSKDNAVVARRIGPEIIMPRVDQAYYYLRRPLGVFRRI